MRSKGSAGLARTGLSQQDIGARVAAKTKKTVSHVAVGKWLRGESKPDPDKRAALKKLFGIEPTSWDEAGETKSKPEPAHKKTGRTVEPIPEGVAGKAQWLEKRVHNLMSELETDAESTPLERARVMASLASTLNLIAKITGQMDLGARFFQLPMWKNVERAIEAALEKYPDAAAAVGNALIALDASLVTKDL